ncbi:alkene reductase [Pyxidicoccus fallax]|uniref:Alkene reductase n=1 Tax=Pyxidicoccus fallax TaxID=394095 RepID=A0A848LEZ9_9BACT|nr:alkene reductase [Pyxidicoccus fallax]NMO15425.1 alkene reductase [Pyxidicoccus fallax]NPC79120.1 alkene reductase [Pyxidicoccus fallax]
MSQQPLFTPFTIGSLKLPQRIVMAPMTRNRAGPEQVPTPLMAEYYAQRASAGLIITEATQASLQGYGYPNTPGIHTDAQVEGWRRVTDAVHARGGRIYVQMWHVGRISHPVMQPGGALPVAPSAIAAEGTLFTTEGPKAFVTPRALELAEIPGIVREFAEGARRAKEAGFDGVEVHGANGYLLDQFLRDGSNHRTDAYGGTVEKRARLLLEVTEAVAGVLGADRVGVRLSPTNPFNSMSDSDPEKTFGYAAGELSRLGLAFLHVMAPVADPRTPTLLPLIRERFRGPLMTNGGHTLQSANAVISDGLADLVAFGVPFLANPDLPERLRQGAPLNTPDKATFYGGDARGYTDYPALTA